MNIHTTILLVQPIFLILTCLHSSQTADAFNLPKTKKIPNAFSPLRSTPTTIQSNTDNDKEERQSLIKDLLRVARTHGPIGIEASETSQREILAIAEKIKTHSIPNASSFPLRGTHSLLYSLASLSQKTGGGDEKKKGSQSAGRIGPLVGRVTQEFTNDEEFQNIVRLLGGAVKVVLDARREVLDGQRIRVEFRTISVYVGGLRLVSMETKGSGIWKVLFVGEFEEEGGKRLLVRVMETPKLFVIVQEL